MNVNQLQELRQKIDSLDEELLRALAKRFLLVQEVRTVKKSAGLPPLDEARWRTVLSSRQALAKELGLPDTFTEKLMRLIHERSLEIEG